MYRRCFAVAVRLLVIGVVAPGCAELAGTLNEPAAAPALAAPPALDPPPMTATEPLNPPEVATATPEPDPVVVRASLEAVTVSPSPSPAPAAVPGPVPAAPQGRVIARVGQDAVTLPQLTAAVKARLADVATTDPDRQPSRKQIVALARASLEARIVASLVDQEGKRVLGESLPPTLDAIQTRWRSEELPRRLVREGVATETDLRSTLARKGRSLDEEREAYRVRSLADEIQARKTGNPAVRMSEREFLASLDDLRERFPVESILTAKQVAEAAGDPQARSEAR